MSGDTRCVTCGGPRVSVFHEPWQECRFRKGVCKAPDEHHVYHPRDPDPARPTPTGAARDG